MAHAQSDPVACARADGAASVKPAANASTIVNTALAATASAVVLVATSLLGENETVVVCPASAPRAQIAPRLARPDTSGLHWILLAASGSLVPAAEMFYLLLILPHLLAVVGLLAWALRTAANSSDGEAEGLSDGGGGLGVPPPEPRPVTPNGGLPLDGSNPPRRRLRAGERLSELHPMPARRDREPHRPERVPAQR
jgi:hypothetical protein